MSWYRLMLSQGFTDEDDHPYTYRGFMTTSTPHTQNPLAEGSHTATINGNQLHYEVRGTGPVLLAPTAGWGPSVDYIMPLPALERHCTVVYIDTRHSGQSTGPEQADQYTLAHFVADLDAVRLHLGEEKVFLAGHSAGGHQALAYGIEHSDRLLGIIAIDAIAAQDDLRMQELLRLVEKRRDHPYYRARPGFIDTAVAILTGADPTPRTGGQMLDAIGPIYFHDPELAAPWFATMQLNEQVMAYTGAAGFQRDNLLDQLHRISVPTLVVVGDDDFICDAISQGGRMLERIPNATLAVITNSGHVPWIEQPATLDRACDDWLTRTITACPAPPRQSR
jgi:proline iminopeptidase